MRIRLAYVGVLSGEKGSPVLKAYEEIVLKAAERVKNPNTEIDFYHLKKGLTHLREQFYMGTTFFNDRELLSGVMELERRGYDGVMIACYYDPVVREARQICDIPVVGPAQPSLLMATMMGNKVGVVTISPEAAVEMQERFVRYIGEKLAGVVPIPATAEEQINAMFGGKHLELEWERFKEAARQLIKKGAEVLIPGCMLMAPNFTINGLNEVDGVPVIDVTACQVKMTEALVYMKKAGSPWISRVGLYGRDKDVVSKAIGKFPYLGSGIFSHKE
jgi:Asp/Glu/hydantoin racemase